jgi:tetratricopeptide (TPR) repeat protein
MLRKLLVAVILLIFVTTVHAQTAEDTYNKYLDFNLARLQGEQDKAMDLSRQIMPDTAKLSAKVKINFFNSLAKLYEDDNQSVNAIPLYERVVEAEPDYYVAHRALGYLYLKNIPDADKPLGNPSTDAEYIKTVKKALTQLEKAQACDADDNTLALIKTLYKNIGDDTGLNGLDKRLKALKGNCEDILSDVR